MAIRRLPDGRWRVDVEPVKGKRFRRIFSTKGEAQRYEAHVKSQAYQPEWEPKKTDRRKLLELITLWHELHGMTLRDHVKTLRRLERMASAMDNPVGEKLTAQHFLSYRNERLASGIKPKTMNVELGLLCAVFNELYRLEQIRFENPLKLVKRLKPQEAPVTFLDDIQILQLLNAAKERTQNPHVLPLCLICLQTGARWSEAEAVCPASIKSGSIVFSNTKSSRVRAVPVSHELIRYLREHWARHGAFTSSLPTFNRVLERSGLKLPEGQASHVLRHTFASRFVQNGGNLVALQKILGHSTINMTMRYAHLAPDHLQESITLNPCANLDTLSTFQNAGKKNP